MRTPDHACSTIASVHPSPRGPSLLSKRAAGERRTTRGPNADLRTRILLTRTGAAPHPAKLYRGSHATRRRRLPPRGPGAPGASATANDRSITSIRSSEKVQRALVDLMSRRVRCQTHAVAEGVGALSGRVAAGPD